jgi:hypothetical protein
MPPTEQQSLKWPTQDGIDRSDAVAIIASIGPVVVSKSTSWDTQVRWNRQEALSQALERIVDEAAREVLPDSLRLKINARPYQVGPAAEGPGYYIATLWEHRDQLEAVASGIANSFAIVEIIRRVNTKLQSWAKSLGDPPAKVSMAFPPAVLQAVCEQHVRDSYHPTARLESRWTVLTEEFFAGYQSPAHPTSNLEYFVEVFASDYTYSFWINGSGIVSKHEKRRGTTCEELPIPDLVAGPDA